LNAAKAAQAAAPDDDENKLRDDVVEKMTLLISQMEAETDPVKKDDIGGSLMGSIPSQTSCDREACVR
jgi:hypothetical protein